MFVIYEPLFLVTIVKLGTLFVVFLITRNEWLPPIRSDIDYLVSKAQNRQNKKKRSRGGLLHGNLIVYLFLLFASILAICVSPFLAHAWTRNLFLAVFLLAFALNQIIIAVTGSRLTLSMVQTLWAERREFPDAMSAFAKPILIQIMVVAALAVPFMINPIPAHSLGHSWTIIPLATLTGIFLWIHIRGISNRQFDGFLSPLGVPVYFALAMTKSAPYGGVREEVDSKLVAAPTFRAVILIIDESVRGDYLTVNDAGILSTPFLAKNSNEIANFGVTCSTANNSRWARLVLRAGLREDWLPDVGQRVFRCPTIWMYAKHAGFRTFYVNAFKRSGLHCFMNKNELRHIDEIIYPKSPNIVDVDNEIAEILTNIVTKCQPCFIIADKMGAHFPYEANFPKEAPQIDAASIILNALSLQSAISKSIRVANYVRALRWRVDTFFSNCFYQLKREDTVVFYTSDHGQSMLESKNSGYHGTIHDPPKGEANVPLFAFTGNRTVQDNLQSAAASNKGKMHHWEVFPTLLMELGYSRKWVSQKYGPSLYDKTVQRNRKFYTTSLCEPNIVSADFDEADPTWTKT